MKNRFFIFLIVLSMLVGVVLCGCNSTENEPSAPTTNTTEPTGEQVEPTDKGLFVTEPTDIDFTLPDDFPIITLPEIELEDATGEARPVETPDPDEESEETPTTAPAYEPPSDVLPEIKLDDE